MERGGASYNGRTLPSFNGKANNMGRWVAPDKGVRETVSRSQIHTAQTKKAFITVESA
jgi:hypothetical protein